MNQITLLFRESHSVNTLTGALGRLDGVSAKALQKIIQFDVDRIVYISCKPTSLVRDMEILTDAGYIVERACAVDMFAGTYNIETIAVLTKKWNAGVRV